MLVELSVMEQRYQAVFAVVQDGFGAARREPRLAASTPLPPKQSLDLDLALHPGVDGADVVQLGAGGRRDHRGDRALLDEQ